MSLMDWLYLKKKALNKAKQKNIEVVRSSKWKIFNNA